MNVFFEISDSAVEDYGYKYLALYDTRKSAVIGGLYRQALLSSDRVWAEEDAGIRYIKNRYSEASTTPVDEREFFWIKLKSYTL